MSYLLTLYYNYNILLSLHKVKKLYLQSYSLMLKIIAYYNTKINIINNLPQLSKFQ